MKILFDVSNSSELPFRGVPSFVGIHTLTLEVFPEEGEVSFELIAKIAVETIALKRRLNAQYQFSQRGITSEERLSARGQPRRKFAPSFRFLQEAAFVRPW
jgi:hypothetical protein